MILMLPGTCGIALLIGRRYRSDVNEDIETRPTKIQKRGQRLTYIPSRIILKIYSVKIYSVKIYSVKIQQLKSV